MGSREAAREVEAARSAERTAVVALQAASRRADTPVAALATTERAVQQQEAQVAESRAMEDRVSEMHEGALFERMAGRGLFARLAPNLRFIESASSL